MPILPAVVLLGLTGLVAAQQGNADSFIDELLAKARNDPNIRAIIDPLFVGRLSFGEGSLSNVKIYGVSSLFRTGPATIHIGERHISIEANLGLQKVRADGRWRYLPYGIVELGGNIATKVDSINCHIKIIIEGVTARLETFSVRYIKGLQVTYFSGTTVLFNSLVKWIINQVLKKNNEKIRRELEKAGQGAIAKALQNFDISKLIPASQAKVQKFKR